VDFEPFRDGSFVDSELGKIPQGWNVGNLLAIAELFDSKRKSLSLRECERMQKNYSYYGATLIIDFIDNYIFDGIYLLMGEDRSVANAYGYPYLQYVFGKFGPTITPMLCKEKWLYNRNAPLSITEKISHP